MKNLELKARFTDRPISNIASIRYVDTLIQRDIYFRCPDGRLKLRTSYGDKEHRAYVIRYRRPDEKSSKVSEYHCYEVADPDQFMTVVAPGLCIETEISKTRKLYMYGEHTRIHIDRVDKLGMFIEIEICIQKDSTMEECTNIMDELIQILSIRDEDRIATGYRELILTLDNPVRDINYYITQGKMFWVVNQEIKARNREFLANSIVPCIFVEIKDGKYLILQLDMSIKFDDYKYTGWRKLIGEAYGIRVDVLLIDVANLKLYNLDGNECEFAKLGRSPVVVDKTYLARFATN